MTRNLILKALGILFLFILLPSCDNVALASEKNQRKELTGKTKKKSLKYFILKPLDTSTQWDQKINIAYTNKSTNLTFEITKTGLKYYFSSPKNPEYKSCNTPLVLPPQQTIQLEVEVEFLSKNKVAYVFEDDVKVYKE